MIATRASASIFVVYLMYNRAFQKNHSIQGIR
jgi:hypothetical protein